MSLGEIFAYIDCFEIYIHTRFNESTRRVTKNDAVLYRRADRSLECRVSMKNLFRPASVEMKRENHIRFGFGAVETQEIDIRHDFLSVSQKHPLPFSDSTP